MWRLILGSRKRALIPTYALWIERRPRVVVVVLQKTILGGYGLREKRSVMWMLRVSRKIVVEMGVGVYGKSNKERYFKQCGYSFTNLGSGKPCISSSGSSELKNDFYSDNLIL